MSYDDSGHRPHARHTGQSPDNSFDYGPQGIRVKLLDWGPRNFKALYAALQANWGEAPLDPSLPETGEPHEGWPVQAHVDAYVSSAFRGSTLQQALERFSFSFLIDGVTRACTHQIVRTRMGAAFMQHGGRDNDWRNRRWTVPETIRRALFGGSLEEGLESCIQDQQPIETFLSNYRYGSLGEAISQTILQARKLYAALVDAGIPWQDARRLLPIGLQTYIFADYNYVALKGLLANRLEHVMDWEINCVAQLMVREIWIHCPEMIARPLVSHSERQQRCAFEDLDSWPPDGKYPWSLTRQAQSRKRTHRREQMPYWVLHPESLRGAAEIHWIATNGVYPHEECAKPLT